MFLSLSYSSIFGLCFDRHRDGTRKYTAFDLLDVRIYVNYSHFPQLNPLCHFS